MRLWLLLLSSLLCFNPLSARAQWTRWEEADGGNGHWYTVVLSPVPISWDQARTNAAASGYLATITSAAENAFVYSLTSDPVFWTNGLGPALGGYQPPGSNEPAGGWTWLTGEPWSYTNWTLGQPDNGDNPGEDGLIFLTGGTWNDKRTNQVSLVSYVIERETEPVIEPSPVTVGIRMSQVELSWVADSGVIYQLEYSTNLVTWSSLGNPIVGVGAKYLTTDAVPADSPRRFYRVSLVK